VEQNRRGKEKKSKKIDLINRIPVRPGGPLEKTPYRDTKPLGKRQKKNRKGKKRYAMRRQTEKWGKSPARKKLLKKRTQSQREGRRKQGKVRKINPRGKNAEHYRPGKDRRAFNVSGRKRRKKKFRGKKKEC